MSGKCIANVKWLSGLLLSIECTRRKVNGHCECCQCLLGVSLKMTGRRIRRRAREEVTRRHIGAVKDDGPTGQTTGQRGSDPSACRVSITGYYNILQGIKPETTQKTWILLSSNAHITKYSTRTATITVKLKITHTLQGWPTIPLFDTGACCNSQLCTLLVKKLIE